jgi:hypothetical protein
MKHVLAIAAVAALVALVVAAPAGATKGPTLKSLQRQITSLQKQVKTLKKRATTDENAIGITLAYSGCVTAVTADTFQDTYSGLDGYFTGHTGFSAYFGAQTPVNDYQLCKVFSVVRAHNLHPPTTSVLGALLDLFKPSGSAAAQHSFMNLTRQGGYLFSQLFVLAR